MTNGALILVDTSVWIDHLRRGNVRLVDLLESQQVVAHPFVIGELACGNLRNRSEIIGLLDELESTVTTEHGEVLHLLEVHSLYGRGLGWIDAHLLASALVAGCRLWTLDKSLAAAARRLDIAL